MALGASGAEQSTEEMWVPRCVQREWRKRGSEEKIIAEHDLVTDAQIATTCLLLDTQCATQGYSHFCKLNTYDVRRRIVLTDTELCCGKVNYPKRLDHIPLHEIVSVEALNGGSPQNQTFNLKGSATNVLRTVSARANSLVRQDSRDSPRGSRRGSVQADDMNEEETSRDTHDLDRDDAFAFEITPIPDGHNSGRSTILRAKDKHEMAEWVEALRAAAVKAAEIEALKNDPGLFSKERRLARAFYASMPVQRAVGVCILASFLTCIVDSQALPEEGSSTAQVRRGRRESCRTPEPQAQLTCPHDQGTRAHSLAHMSR